jgi:hypothetical protein
LVGCLAVQRKKQPDRTIGLTLENLLPGDLVFGRIIRNCLLKKTHNNLNCTVPVPDTGTEWNTTNINFGNTINSVVVSDLFLWQLASESVRELATVSMDYRTVSTIVRSLCEININRIIHDHGHNS